MFLVHVPVDSFANFFWEIFQTRNTQKHTISPSELGAFVPSHQTSGHHSVITLSPRYLSWLDHYTKTCGHGCQTVHHGTVRCMVTMVGPWRVFRALSSAHPMTVNWLPVNYYPSPHYLNQKTSSEVPCTEIKRAGIVLTFLPHVTLARGAWFYHRIRKQHWSCPARADLL